MNTRRPAVVRSLRVMDRQLPAVIKPDLPEPTRQELRQMSHSAARHLENGDVFMALAVLAGVSASGGWMTILS